MAIEPTAQDQYMLELLNRARLNPQAEADLLLAGNLNEGLPLGTISTAAKQPLAFNLKLFQAAQSHSQWMLANNTFSHAGANGSQVWDRATSAGYTWSGIGENLAWRGTTGTPDLTTEVGQQHKDLFIDAGIIDRGHRTNMMLASFREIGISSILGIFTSNGTPYNSAITTQNFGKDFGANAFLTGVAYTDKVVNDDFYTVGEGLGNIIVTAVGNAQTFTTTSLSSGGYSLRLAPGTYSVTFGGDFNNDGIADTSTARTVIIGSENVKQDFASDTQSTEGDDILFGNVNADTINGQGGNDRISGLGGNDVLDGGDGNDTLIGGVGNDTLIGGNGNDTLDNAGGGADTLLGGGGNDTYIVSRNLGGGTIIDDLSGTNDTLSLIGGASLTTNEISRNGTTLLVDMNQNNIFDPTTDLSIRNFFGSTTGSSAGNGFIENFQNFSGSSILSQFKAVRNDFNGDKDRKSVV